MFLIRLFTLVVLSTAIFSCKKKVPEKVDPVYTNSQSYQLENISYGDNPYQKMDVYLPANRTEDTKVFVMVHGGGWNAGDKADFKASYDWLYQVFPNAAIININYRLGTLGEPGYDMQIDDIKKAITEIRKPYYNVGKDLFMVGSSAGGHLAMMYAYRHDTELKVKGVCNFVGPVDFTDSAYLNNQEMAYGLIYLIGPYTYASNPEKWRSVCPVNYIKANSAPTISFYGEVDDLIPNTQMDLLNAKLTEKGVVHQSTMYPGEGHSAWSNQTYANVVAQLYPFIRTHFIH